jgi:hypothetical protein
LENKAKEEPNNDTIKRSAQTEKTGRGPRCEDGPRNASGKEIVAKKPNKIT